MSASKWILYCVPSERIFILPSINKCSYFIVIIYREYNHFKILHQKVPPRSDRFDLLKVWFGKSKGTQVAHIDTHALHGLLLVPLQDLRQLYWLSQDATCCFLLLSHRYSLLCDMWFSAILVLIFHFHQIYLIHIHLKKKHSLERVECLLSVTVVKHSINNLKIIYYKLP